MMPELDIELIQTVDLRQHHVKKVTDKNIKEIVEEESSMAKPNKATAAAGSLKVGSKEEVKQSLMPLSPMKPINLFKKRKSPQAKDVPSNFKPILEELKRKERAKREESTTETFKETQ